MTTSTTTPRSFMYAHRGAGPRRAARNNAVRTGSTTYVVVSRRKVVGAVATLLVILAGLLLLAFTPAGQRECAPVPVMTADVGHLAAQGWTVATGETMVAPGCAHAG